MLSNDELWDKCGTGHKFTFEEIGLDPQKHKNGTQTLVEGFELKSDIDIFREIGVALILIISATIALELIIMR